MFRLLLVCCFSVCSLAAIAADPMEKTKSGWAQVPGGTVWLNPGDAYEHDTGLVRDRTGQKRYPTTPESMRAPAQPSAPAVPPYAYPPPIYHPAPVYPPAPAYPQPFRNPYYNPAPVYGPPAYPYYQSPYDHGPYLPDGSCPSCPQLQRRPGTHQWGLGELDPMDVPKTGDGPIR